MGKSDPSKPTLWQVIVSVLGAFFGVQSSEVRERDFTRGHAWWVYVTVGVIFCLILVGTLIAIVKIILVQHGVS